MKKTIFITDQFMTGGVETVFLHISAYIEKKIVLIPLHKKYNQKLVSSIPENVEINREFPGISRSLVDFLKIPFLAFNQRKKLKVNRGEKVINFSDTLSSLLFAYFLNPYNCISWIHCNPKALLKSKNSKLYFYLLSKCKQIVFLSNSQKALFFSLKESKNINYQKAKICTNFFNEAEIMEESKQKVSKTENSYFFTAARLDLRSKDFVTLIDGYDRLPISIKSKYSLIIAGDGPDKEKIKNYILEKKLMDNIYLIGDQNNVYKYMSKAKLYIHSSVSEGFSMAILEALECGATVVSSDCEVGPRELLLDGKYGFLYQVHNADDLSLKIRLALEKPIDRSKAIDRANQISNKGMEEIRSFLMNKDSVSSIVVTYNRKRKLVRCLKALLKQSYKLDNIIIIDNASNDGTFDAISSFLDLKEIGNINTNHLFNLASKNSINIYYFRVNENNGGSFGFYLGMKIAHEKFHTDTYWLMDDDGYPDVNCLSVLIENLNNYDYVMPTSIDIENHLNLSWPVRMKNGVKTSNFKQLKQSWGKVMEFVTPFNGALLTEKCIDNVGYINKKFLYGVMNMIITGDAKKKGINPVTILSAKFYHPSQKLPLVKICFGLFRAPYVDSKLRMVCLVRNYTYIYKRYNQSYKIPLKFIQYTWLFLITRHFDIDGWILYLKSVHDGLVGDFSRHKKYLNGGN